MPEFTVPKFIEQEPKILGPLTLKQTLIMMTGAGICFFLYFTIGKENLFLFILLSLVIMGGFSALTFLKIKGYPILTFFRHFLAFSITSKLFLWRRKFAPPKIKKIEKFEKEEKKKGPTLKVSAKGKLQKLATRVETQRR